MTEILEEHSLVTQDHGAVASRTHKIRYCYKKQVPQNVQMITKDRCTIFFQLTHMKNWSCEYSAIASPSRTICFPRRGRLSCQPLRRLSLRKPVSKAKPICHCVAKLSSLKVRFGNQLDSNESHHEYTSETGQEFSNVDSKKIHKCNQN